MNNKELVELEARSVRFYSECDEAAFFEWLKKLSCVRKIQGQGAGIFISVDPVQVDEEALRELLSLFRRYEVDLRQLAEFDRDEFVDWFHDSKAYWFTHVFG